MKRGFVIKSPGSQLADELRRRILAGEWSDKLPGIRKIMAEFDVTRTTTEEAFAELEAQGDLIRGGLRAAARATPRSGVEADKKGTLLVLDTPLDLRGGDHREFIMRLRESIRGEVEVIALSSRQKSQDEIVRIIGGMPYRRVLLFDHRGEIADRLKRFGKTVVGCGLSSISHDTSQVAVGHEILVRQAFRNAFAAGHRRVSFPLWAKEPDTVARIRTWVAGEYAAAGCRHAVEFDAPRVDSPDPRDYHACLRMLLMHTPPTAFIVADIRQWIAMTCVLAESGLRIPHDASVISLSSSPEFDVAMPPPAHFRFPVAKLVKTTLALLAAEERGETSRLQLLEPIWVAGGSLGPPPSGKHE